MPRTPRTPPLIAVSNRSSAAVEHRAGAERARSPTMSLRPRHFLDYQGAVK
jgi:hypothetical protein